jgi:hypothetical protein
LKTDVLAEKARTILLSSIPDSRLASATTSSSLISLYAVREITSSMIGFSLQKLPLNMVMMDISSSN